MRLGNWEFDVESLAPGSHEFYIIGADGIESDHIQVTVYLVTDTFIDSAVDGNGVNIADGGFSVSSSITFSFSVDEQDNQYHFACSLNGGAFEDCGTMLEQAQRRIRD